MGSEAQHKVNEVEFLKDLGNTKEAVRQRKKQPLQKRDHREKKIQVTALITLSIGF